MATTQKRPPIIAVVGHIDHGKSTLQHALRKADAALSEAGDITQHIGAYELHAQYEGAERRATIIDTPGHEAFSMVREHGLDLADIALLVVSSEEGWKEQTAEAYATIQEKQLPHIIVFTMLDKPQANIERAKQTVLQHGVLLEGLGGSVPWIGVSSITGEGISDLIELIFLTTDVYEIIEDRQDGSVGILVEAVVDPKIGITGTVIVLQGTLEQSKYIRVGATIAPLRIMKDDRGNTVLDAKPSMPIQVAGFDAVPPVGHPVFLCATKKEALETAEAQQSSGGPNRVADSSKQIVIPLVLRSDTASGLSSIQQAIAAVASDGVQFTVIKSSVGDITEEDVRLALAEDGGQVLGFHTNADQRAKQLAERSGIALHLFPTIYEVTQWATTLSKQKREGYEVQNPTGAAAIIRIFEEQSSQRISIVGAQIQHGSFAVEQHIAVLRNKEVVGRFIVESIEQRNKSQETVSGEKAQFAMRIRGDGAVKVGDTVLALPTAATP
ncbi:MAG: GTP-binding protein [Candidatus Kaiserbacteria bacterium]|nr:GTP-binding protein [Candidatus Kaiserbacteria bacterium]